MPKISSKGKCLFCQAEFSKAGMSKHLASCRARLNEVITPGAKNKPGKLIHLVVEGQGAAVYWMHLETSVDTTLIALDRFLRDKWLECCGHLSAFEIGGQSYISSVDPSWGSDDKSMKGVKLGKVATPGQTFNYDYDFGSTTELKLKVVDEREGMTPSKEPIRLMAENEAPVFSCEVCGKPATSVCCQCIYDGTGFVCEEHEEEHECGEDMLLPVVNSPRMGVCAYSG